MSITKPIREGSAVYIRTETPISTPAGVAVDPDVVSYDVKYPSGDIESFVWYLNEDPGSPEIERLGTGDFRVRLDTSGQAGQWIVQLNANPVDGGLDETQTQLVVDYDFHVLPKRIVV
jgi:hypothetical protein